MTFGEKLIKYRNDNRLTQDELAKIVGTTKQVISRYEKEQRTPKIDVAQEYAKKLNLPVLYLVDNNVTIIPATDTNVLTNHEGKVVTAYRDKPMIQPAVDKLLDIEPEDNLLPFTEPSTKEITFDDFAYAMYDEKKELTDEDKKNLLGMAKMLKERKDKEK